MKSTMKLFLLNVYFMIMLRLIKPENVTLLSTRNERIFPFLIFPLFRHNVVPTPCTTSSGQDGICYSSSRCTALGLTPSGICLTGTGVCCTATKTCGDTSASPVIYFNNPASLPARCILKITRANSTITQLRIDFLKFSLRQPQNGRCTNYLSLSPTDGTLPRLCGENSGSHVYVDIDPLCYDHTLQFNLADLTSNDQWNLKITQIPYTSDLEAPRGCLMYYSNSASGTVTSFNYGTTRDNDTRQLSPLNYGVCIRPLPGYCQIKWSLGDFFMSNNGAACDRNYVVIPGSSPENEATATFSDRYCNNEFPNPNTSSKPYVLYVKTNVDETDSGTTGFNLNFQQMGC